MRKVVPYFLLLFLFFMVNAGFDVVSPEAYRPVFMLRSELEKGIMLESPRAIKNPG